MAACSQDGRVPRGPGHQRGAASGPRAVSGRGQDGRSPISCFTSLSWAAYRGGLCHVLAAPVAVAHGAPHVTPQEGVGGGQRLRLPRLAGLGPCSARQDGGGFAGGVQRGRWTLTLQLGEARGIRAVRLLRISKTFYCRVSEKTYDCHISTKSTKRSRELGAEPGDGP